MGALSFKGQFVPKVIAGLKHKPGGKRQSIRNFRKRPLKVGEWLALYFAQRSEWCQKLGESTVVEVQIIQVTEKRIKIYDFRNDYQRNIRWDLVAKNPRRLKEFLQRLKLVRSIYQADELNAFAKADGLRNWETMKRWWKLTHGPDALPFTGNLYKW